MIFLPIFAVFALYGMWKDGLWDELGAVLFLVVVCSAVCSLIAGAVVYSGTHSVTKPAVSLESLVDGAQLRGEFFLGSGTINDVATYTWYEKHGGNAYVQQRADADSSVIHFLPRSTGQKPYYVKRVKAYDDGAWMGLWGFRLSTGEVEGTERYDFYVPAGTIAHNFELDAK